MQEENFNIFFVDVNEKLKEETDPLKQARILCEKLALKGVK